MIYNVTVLGAGFLGVHIAGMLSQHGHRVKIYDLSSHQLQQVFSTLQQHKQHLINEGILVDNNTSPFPGDISCTDNLRDAVIEADYVIEAIAENLVAKQTLFQGVEQHCPKSCVISTNTLSLNINDISSHLPASMNILGLRFLYPVYYVPEVEITLAKQTTQECIQQAQNLMDSIGKVLYFRSDNHPLVLNSEQIQSRKQAYRQMISSSQSRNISQVPDIGHGSVQPAQNRQQLQKLNKRREQLECTVCLDKERDSLICPCHHMCVCATCAKILQNQGGVCPICRQKITDIIKVFSP